MLHAPASAITIPKSQATEINQAGCDLARKVADESGGLIAAGVTHLAAYHEGKDKKFVQGELRKQIKVFLQNQVDFVIAEVRLLSADTS